MAMTATIPGSIPIARTAAHWAGFFDSVTECDKAVTDIDGAIPDGLAGTLYRNGPGRRDFADSYFDGDGLIRALRIGGDGAVRYRARFVRTEKYLAERGSQRPRRRLAGTNLPGGPLRNMFRVPAHYFAANPSPGEGGSFRALMKLDCSSGRHGAWVPHGLEC